MCAARNEKSGPALPDRPSVIRVVRKGMRGLEASESECKPRSELELARGVDGLRNLSKGLTLLLHTHNGVDAGISVLRRIAHVVAGDIEAQRFRFRDFERLVKGHVEVTRAAGANVIKIGRSGSRSEGIRIRRTTGLSKAINVEPIVYGMGSTTCRVADHVSPLVEI